jgi:hypothetical protein
MSDETENTPTITLGEVRREIKERGESFRSQFEGDICDGKQPAVGDYIDAKTAPFVNGFADSMRAFGIESPEEAVDAVQNNPLLREQAFFASANVNAIAKDAGARYGDACDADFQRLAGRAAFDRHGNLRPEVRDTAVEYLKSRGLSAEQIRNEYEFGELRHPVNQAKTLGLSQKWKSEQKQMKDLDEKYASGSISLRDAARRRALKNR